MYTRMRITTVQRWQRAVFTYVAFACNWNELESRDVTQCTRLRLLFFALISNKHARRKNRRNDAKEGVLRHRNLLCPQNAGRQPVHGHYQIADIFHEVEHLSSLTSCTLPDVCRSEINTRRPVDLLEPIIQFRTCSVGM